MCVASLGLINALEVKVLKANIIEPLEINTSEPLVTNAQNGTKVLNTLMKDKTKKERDEAYPPYTLVCVRIVEGAATAAEAALPEDDPDRRLLCEYWQGLKAVTGGRKTEEIMTQVRFCMICGTHLKARSIIDMGAAALGNDFARVWAATKRVFIAQREARLRRGMAPKTGVERRIEQALRMIKA